MEEEITVLKKLSDIPKGDAELLTQFVSSRISVPLRVQEDGSVMLLLCDSRLKSVAADRMEVLLGTVSKVFAKIQ